MDDNRNPNRKSYVRLHAPTYLSTLARRRRGSLRKRQSASVALDALCVYTDDDVEEGTSVELEAFLPDGTTVSCEARVEWVDTFPPGAHARHDVGLRLTAIHPRDEKRLATVVEMPDK